MTGVSGLAGDPSYPAHQPNMPPVPLGKTGSLYARAVNKLGWHWWPSDIAVATTGIAGPTGGSAEKPVGTVCIGLATPDQALGYQFHFNYGRRSLNKQMFAMKALDVLRRELLGLPHTHRSP